MLLLVHGGAGAIRPGKRTLKKLYESISSGYSILKSGGSALTAVAETIKILEDSGHFNAGLGANLQLDGVRRLDASLMEGKSLRAGSVIGLEGIRNPIIAARALMDLPNIMLTNVGAKRVAQGEKIKALPPVHKRDLDRLQKKMRKEKAFMQLFDRYFSTVGAVALDSHGDLAAGASTGGIITMFPGRVGDTPIIGAGIYAENSLGAASCTGIGEYILRLSLAKEVCMNLQNKTPHSAAASSLKRLKRIGGQAGLILIDRGGRFSIMHTTDYMASGYADKKGINIKEAFKNL